MGPVAGDLGWDPRPDDGERTPSLRASVLRTLGVIGDDPDVQAEAVLRFHQALSGETVLHPDTEAAILDIVASPAAPTSTRPSWPATGLRPTPKRRSATSTPWARSATSDLANRTFDLAMSRGADPERALPARIDVGQPDHRAD